MARKKLIAVDCETDPFKHGRVPKPFVWGAFDGKHFFHFKSTEEFVDWLSQLNCVAYAHNGGKFDFMFLLKYVKRTRARIIGGRFAEMEIGRAKLRDSYSIIPVPLAAVQKDEIDYDLMEEEVRENYMTSHILPYLKTDCIYLYQMVDKYREVAGKGLTIAGNALSNSRALGADPGKTNFRFDTEFRQYYYGGRTECFRPGTHRDVTVVDIVSSYPFAMLQDHPTGDDRVTSSSLDGLTKDQINQSFIEVECYSKGAFPFKNEKGGLDFPYGKRRFTVTGWEYVTAKRHRLILNEKIISVKSFQNTISFKNYVYEWFKFKSSHNKKTHPIEYTIGKIMMNSLYGKLAQNPLKYFDYEIHDPGTKVNSEEGWELYTEFLGVEVHRRPVMWKYEFDHGKSWIKQPLFFNVATGASITGFARAHLLNAIHTVGENNVVYCDTDSIMMTGNGWKKLDLGDQLGQWENEATASIAHFAGKKLTV